MTHLVIAGHGKQRNGTFDPGAIGFITKGEHKYVVEDLFPAMKKHLPKGHDVVFFDKYKVSNHGNIVALAKEYKAKQITEIHFDAAGNPSARGGHVIVHSDFSPDKTDLALRDAIKKVVGVRYSHKGHDGISGRNNLFNVNQTAKAGITYRLIELGFGSNKADADILTGKVDEYAKELVKAITGKVEQVSKPNPNPTPSKPAPSKPVEKPSTNQTTSIVDYLNDLKINSSPSNRKKLAVEYGVKNYDLSAAKNTELLNKMRSGKPVSKPAAKPTPTPVPKDKTLQLPKSASSWRVYPTNKAPVKANALKTRLNPAKFGGLSYAVLGNPQKDVYTIQTQQVGRVNIYAGPGTGAVIK